VNQRDKVRPIKGGSRRIEKQQLGASRGGESCGCNNARGASRKARSGHEAKQ